MKVSFTKTQGLLFSSLPRSLLLVLAPPSTLSSIKASELQALSAEGSPEAGGVAKEAGGRWQAWAGEEPSPATRCAWQYVASSSSVPVQPLAPAGHGVQVPPSPAPSYEVTLLDTSCEKSAVYCPSVLAFFALLTSELCSPHGSRTMQIVLSKGKKTDFIALFVFVFVLFFNKKHGRCILCLVILGVLLFSVLRGVGPAKPFRENMGPEDMLSGKSWVCSTQKRRSQTLCHSE